MLFAIYKLAMQRGQLAVALRVLKLIGNEIGMFIQQHKVRHEIEQRMREMTQEQRQEYMAGLIERARARLAQDAAQRAEEAGEISEAEVA